MEKLELVFRSGHRSPTGHGRADVIRSRPMAVDGAYEVLQVLLACRSLELAVAGLYQELAEQHQHVPSVATLWKKTAREELNHAAQFTLAIETMSDLIETAVVSAAVLDRIRLAVENTIEEYALCKPTVREALVAAIDFEGAMATLHGDQILVFRDPRGTRLFQAMMAADHGHVTALRGALSGLGAA
jgi:rubrerythrin